MLAQMPVRWEELGKDELDKEIIRTGIITELNAINLHEELSTLTKDDHIRGILLDLAREAKAHAEIFQALLLEYDNEQREEKLKRDKSVDSKLQWNMY